MTRFDGNILHKTDLYPVVVFTWGCAAYNLQEGKSQVWYDNQAQPFRLLVDRNIRYSIADTHDGE